MNPEHEKRLAQLRTARESGLLDEDTYQTAVAALNASIGGAVSVGDNATMTGATAVGPNPRAIDNPGVYVEGGMRDIHNHLHLTQETASALLAKLPPATTDLGPATSQYLGYIANRYRFLEFKGMGVNDRAPLNLPLLEMYVPLKARIELPDGDTWAHELRLAGRTISREEVAEIGGRRVSEPQPLLTLLQKNPGLIILGDPGAGKTTFLKYLALNLALGQDMGLGHRLPVLVSLAAYANALAQKDVPLHEFIVSYYREAVGAELPIAPLLEAALQSGQALLLLDGLDEVQAVSQKLLVVQRVVDFFSLWQSKDNKFVLTSRIVGYKEVRPSVPGLVEGTLVDFGPQEIAQFVEQWTTAVETAAQGQANPIATAEAEREKRELLQATANNPGVRRLAANPLLLTILALMKRQGISLPERRAELYEQYVQTLLKHWNLARSLGRPSTYDLDVRETLRALAPLALWMHRTSPGVGLVKGTALRRELVRIYQTRQAPDPEHAADNFMRDVRQHASLLLERGQGMYGFIHLTFQEYLAAVAIAQTGQTDPQPIIDTFAAHLHEPSWREVLLLTIGYLGLVQGRDEAAGEVLLQLIAQAPGTPGHVEAFAGEAVADVGQSSLPPACCAEIRTALLKAMTDDPRVKPPERAKAGQVLAQVGDPRHGVLSREPEMIEIPAGTFLMGEKKYRLTLSAFAIAKYPVTNAQYRFFVEDGGYTPQQQTCWTEAGWNWLQQDAERQVPYFWDDPTYNALNQPVVGVTWYEVIAYTRWLNQATGQPYRLPTEAEWERVARHTDGRSYPWGEWQENCANYDKLGLDRPTAVGLFPKGMAQCGALDIAGNVWEWCQSQYANEPYNPTDGREQITEVNIRVLRGGGYYSRTEHLSCVYRLMLYPRDYFGYSGFRLCMSLL